MSVDPACRVSRGAQGWPGPPSDDCRSQGDAREGEVLFKSLRCAATVFDRYEDS